MTKRAFPAGLPKPERAFTTHKGDWDTMLVRIGHHLWRWYKQAYKNLRYKEGREYLDACFIVWGIKDAYREPVRAARKASTERIRAYARKRKG